MKHDAPDPAFMRMAIARAVDGIAAGQTPFGACIVRDGRAVACSHNTVWQTTDSTAHAEVNAIREACRILGTIDLSGTTIYSTTEPCPMCFSAIHWAKIPRIVFGSSIADAAAAGFSELDISNADMRKHGRSLIAIVPGFLREEAMRLFAAWAARPGRRTY